MKSAAEFGIASWIERFTRTFGALICIAAMVMLTTAVSAAEDEHSCEPEKTDIQDPYVNAWHDLVYDQKPPDLVAGVDYGMDPTGSGFVHPKATPLDEDEAPRPFPGQLDYWEQKSYAKNMDVLAFYSHITTPFQSWQAIADFDGRRYMYVSYRFNLAVWDITDPRNAKLITEYGNYWGSKGPVTNEQQLEPGQTMGGIIIRWSPALKKLVLVQSGEYPRFGVFEDKLHEPEGVDQIRNWKYNKGFTVYAMNGPLPSQWDLIATRTTDFMHPDVPAGEQRGTGALDTVSWYGGRYMFLSAAPDDSYALTEYPNYLHSPGYQSWDMSDPANPQFLDQLVVPGQIVGDPEHEAAYLMNPRAGNRTSWMGSRMPLFIPTPVEKGGKIGFAAMGGLGFYVVDISDPAKMKVISHLAFPPKVAGTEADNIDVSQYNRTGYVFMNGYPMNNDCYEPYKDVFVIDVRDLEHPSVATTFPRPIPPADAPYVDYCQRRGSFGPKRPGYMGQPGESREGYIPYAFYNAGIQLFDVHDPVHPQIAGYYVPRFPKPDEVPEFVNGNLAYGLFAEYDRNVIWMFTNHGMYALGSPLLGEPVNGVPEHPWPPKE